MHTGFTARIRDPLCFAGPANPALAHAVATGLGTSLAACEFTRFPDGEVGVRLDVSVRGRDVVLVQPTSPPVNDNLMALLAFADACRRASAASLTAVVPYFGYARGDRRQGLRVPVSASLVAELMEAAGIHHVVAVHLHAPQVEGFFRIPVDEVSAVPVLCSLLDPRPDMVVVAPDLGAAKLASQYGRRLGLPVAVVHKLRMSATEVTSVGLTGDVRGRRCVIVDDMITTGATIEAAVTAVRTAGATGDIVVAATHGVLTGQAWDRLQCAGVGELLLTDTVALSPWERPRTRVASVAPLIAGVLARMRHEHEPATAPSAQDGDSRS